MLQRIGGQDALNYVITNRIPRRFATSLAGRIARIENRWVTRVGIAVWEALSGSLALDEAASTEFARMPG
ncbi:MAG TPA: hypothetical protein VGM50_04730 [Gemmatimonadaceae bacterium]